MKLLVDENLPPRMARSLQALFEGKHSRVSLREKFGRTGIKDLEWIRALTIEGSWSILSADVRLSKNKVERNAFLSGNLVGFVMSPDLRKRTELHQMARILYM